jgi:hypothetical protein
MRVLLPLLTAGTVAPRKFAAQSSSVPPPVFLPQ